MASALQNILILVGIVLILGLGYYLFMQEDELNSHNQQVQNQAAVETDEFLRRLHELKDINLDSSFFSDPRFTTLVPYTEEEPRPEPYSKANPFLSN